MSNDNAIDVNDRTIQRFSSLWIGKALGPYEALCMSSFVSQGHQYLLYTYDPQMKAPSGVQIADANVIIPGDAVFENSHQKGSYAIFADLFRYQLLRKEDTTWVDTDIMLLTPSFPENEYIFGYELPEYVNVAVIRAPRKSALITYLSIASQIPDHRDIYWGEIGPTLMTHAVRCLDLSDLVLEKYAFYEIHGREVWKLFAPECLNEVKERLDESVALHLWNSTLTRAGIKDAAPPVGSYMAEKFNELQINVDWDRELTREWVNTDFKNWLNRTSRYGLLRDVPRRVRKGMRQLVRETLHQ